MKLPFALCLLLASISLQAPSVKLAWDESLEPGVVGYSLYWRLNDHNYTGTNTGFAFIVGKTNTTVTVPNLEQTNAVYNFVVTSSDGLNQESPYSNEAHWTNGVAPGYTNDPLIPPQRLRVVIEAQHSASVSGPWEPNQAMSFVAETTNGGTTFWRAVLTITPQQTNTVSAPPAPAPARQLRPATTRAIREAILRDQRQAP